uniref:Uncharacterized protein n=1 Tax=Leersia perrieri TaxID=77586 RepID=A0A0D9WPR7_9ORYZ
MQRAKRQHSHIYSLYKKLSLLSLSLAVPSFLPLHDRTAKLAYGAHGVQDHVCAVRRGGLCPPALA